MLNRFFHQLREAVVERRAAYLPPAAFHTIVAVACVTIVYILLATILVPDGEPRHYHFAAEKGGITALSAIFLSAASAFSLASLAVLIRTREPHKWVWVVMALGLAFFAFDELLQFHEQAGRYLRSYKDSGPFRNWNDIIVILYGIVTLPVLIAMLPGLLRWRMVIEMFLVAFLFYGIHTFIDVTSSPSTPTSSILEESAKVMAGAFLLIGTVMGFIGMLWKNGILEQARHDP